MDIAINQDGSSIFNGRQCTVNYFDFNSKCDLGRFVTQTTRFPYNHRQVWILGY